MHFVPPEASVAIVSGSSSRLIVWRTASTPPPLTGALVDAPTVLLTSDVLQSTALKLSSRVDGVMSMSTAATAAETGTRESEIRGLDLTVRNVRHLGTKERTHLSQQSCCTRKQSCR